MTTTNSRLQDGIPTPRSDGLSAVCLPHNLHSPPFFTFSLFIDHGQPQQANQLQQLHHRCLPPRSNWRCRHIIAPRTRGWVRLRDHFVAQHRGGFMGSCSRQHSNGCDTTREQMVEHFDCWDCSRQNCYSSRGNTIVWPRDK